jgi:hypothetical protein
VSAAVVRQALYDAVVNDGAAPGVGLLAARTGLTPPTVEAALRALADAHVVVLDDETGAVRFAPPFANVETPFRVLANGRSWFAPCAWDAFGIPAALKLDAHIHTSCAWSGESLRCAVVSGRPFGTGVVHLLVPAAHFWDDIVYT